MRPLGDSTRLLRFKLAGQPALFGYLLLLFLHPNLLTAKPSPPKRALTLYWHGREFLRNVLIDQGMQKVFRSANLPMLDWRQLRRRGISEDQAPTGSVIKFKEESYWDLYKWRVIGVISICVVEALLILGLLAQRARRRRVEEDLRDNKDWLNLALSAANMGAWDWRLDTTELTWSDETRQIFDLADRMSGITPEAFIDLIYLDDRPVVSEAVTRTLKQGAPYEVEFRLASQDGSQRWLISKGKALLDEAGRATRMLGIYMDVTARKRDEQSLRKSDEALRDSYARIEDLAGRLLAAQEDERKHIARELHDDLNQQVAALAMGISRLKRQFPEIDSAVREQLAKLREKTELLSERIRQMSRELHSSILQHVGLPAALNSYCAEFSERESIAVALDIQNGLKALPPDTALCLYRVAQESLRNVAKHSGARNAVVSLARVNGAVELRVADSGAGFDPGQAREFRGLGLISMEERVKLLGGSFELTTQPGVGTEVRAKISLGREIEQTQSIIG
jgi:signal transduction histidine kinase